MFLLSKVHSLHASFVKNKKFSGGTSGLGTGVTSATMATMDFCHHEPCMMHGKCVSRQDRYECHCYARYSGNNCQIDNGRPRRYLEYAAFTAYVGRTDSYSTRALNGNVTSYNYACVVTRRYRPVVDLFLVSRKHFMKIMQNQIKILMKNFIYTEC